MPPLCIPVTAEPASESPFSARERVPLSRVAGEGAYCGRAPARRRHDVVVMHRRRNFPAFRIVIKTYPIMPPDLDDTACLRRNLGTYVRHCFAAESPPRVGELAHILGVSRAALEKRLRTRFGVTAATYLKLRQVRRAKALLVATALPTTTVGYRAAFGTRRTFHRRFLHLAGMTPAEYRRTRRQALRRSR